MNQLTPIFIGMIGMRNVNIEIDDKGMYSVTALQIGTENSIKIHGETPGQLERNLIIGGLFSEDEARQITYKIVHR